MIPRATLSHRKCFAGFVLAFVLSTCAIAAVGGEYSKNSVDQLIDDLTKIDAQAPGISSAAIYEGFIADNSPGAFGIGVLGTVPPHVPPEMSELVRRGPVALPELIKHLDDKRMTRLEVGNKPSGRQIGIDAFMFMFFSDEYDARVPHWWSDEELRNGHRPMEKHFEGKYTVKVGDVCYVLIGQIVNRRLLAVRYQPSAGLIVTSPIEAPALVEKVKSDWGSADAETLKASLLTDIQAANHPTRISKTQYTERFVYPALQRLRFYFPVTYAKLEGHDLQKRKEFEGRETEQHQSLSP